MVNVDATGTYIYVGSRMEFSCADASNGIGPITILCLNGRNLNRVGISGLPAKYAPLAPTYSLSFNGDGNQTIGLERNTTVAGPGKNLTIQAGGAIAGTSNIGGNLILSSGIAVGTGTSYISFCVSSGMTGTTDANPYEVARITQTGIFQSTNIKCLSVSGYTSSDGSLGATGTFTTVDSKIVTVKDGIITSIV